MHCHWHTSVFKFLATLIFILVSLYRRNHPYRHHEADLQYMAQVPVIKQSSLFRIGCLTQLCAGIWGVEELESRRCPIESRSLFDDDSNITKLLVSGELTVDASPSCLMDDWRWVTEDADDDSSMCSMGESMTILGLAGLSYSPLFSHSTFRKCSSYRDFGETL